jgi:hypothetical protein
MASDRFENSELDGLWYKLLMCNIKGKMYNVILTLYNNIKSRIVYNDSVSNVFPCLNGVRQGENLSPFLFALYLNDLDTFLTSKNAQGVKSISEDFENDLQIYVKLFTILYADDTVLLAESAEELQSELNYFYEYCEKWNLKVNTNKSKVIVFSKGRLPINLNFKMNNMELEIVSEFIYLGTMFQRTGSCKKNQIYLAEKASKAMHDILSKGRVHSLFVSCQLALFDKIIIPMLTYGSEIWGYEIIGMC